MNKHSNFIVKELNNLSNPIQGSRDTYHDTNVAGLTLRVTSTGVKSFVIRKRINGKPVMTTLGRYPAMTITQARVAARETLNVFSSGVNPNIKKIEQRIKSITLQEVMRDYISSRKHALKDKTIKDYQILFNSYLSEWSGKELINITRSMVVKKHATVGDKSIYRANATMRLLRALFNFAISEYDDSNDNPIITHNPVQKIKRNWFKESVRTNIIEPNDLSDWFAAVNALPNNKANTNRKNTSETVRDYLILLLFTGLRSSEGINLEWSNIDFKNELLSIQDTKNREDHTIPLTQYILDLLEARKKASQGNYVFPGYDPSKALVSPNKQVKKVINDSGVQFLLHDLRRTFATYADSLKIQHNTIKRLMNHKNNDVTSMHYIHQSIETLRDPMQKITDYIIDKSK
jgi:integrase|tara:strand:+ start:208 stop:1419 length:1212 start_codon:yes stop_codon:yes gene_type:complete